MPVNSEEYEKFKNGKLQQLKPIVLDDPEPKYLEENDKQEKDDNDRNGEGIRGRVAPRNPRLAVYGGGLEDISALFSSGNYDPGAADKFQGTFTSLYLLIFYVYFVLMRQSCVKLTPKF